MAAGITIYCDDSGGSCDRYRTVAALSVDEAGARELRRKVTFRHELKWCQIKSSERAREAIDCVRFVLPRIRDGRIGLNVITFDTHDPKYSVCGRDDPECMARLYSAVIASAASLCPRAPSSIVLDASSGNHAQRVAGWLSKMPATGGLTLAHRKYVSCVGSAVSQADSRTEPLIGLVDLFAGLLRYTHIKGIPLRSWVRAWPAIQQNAPCSLLQSRSDSARVSVIEYLSSACWNAGLPLWVSGGTLMTRGRHSNLVFRSVTASSVISCVPLRAALSTSGRINSHSEVTGSGQPYF